MKNLLVKKWKNIFIAIGVAIIALVLYNKISWQPNIVNSYIESDINIKSDVIDGIKGTTALNKSTKVITGQKRIIFFFKKLILIYPFCLFWAVYALKLKKSPI